jgi:hypothetical protein
VTACDIESASFINDRGHERVGFTRPGEPVTPIEERLMAKRSALTFVLVAALLAGCAGADSAAPDNAVEDVSPEPTTPVASSRGTATANCEELADELIAQLQVIVDELSDATLDDLGRDDLLPAGTQQQLDDLEERVEDAGCDDEMDRLLAERADRIQGDGVIAEAVREGLSQGGDLPF